MAQSESSESSLLRISKYVAKEGSSGSDQFPPCALGGGFLPPRLSPYNARSRTSALSTECLKV